MARTFTRLTFAGPSGRADMSVPDDLPVALLVQQVRELVRAPAGARWVITHPLMGDLAPELTLRDAGVLDGELLYLRQPGDAYRPPYAEDVAEEAGDSDPRYWSPAATRTVMTVAAAVWLGLAAPVVLWSYGAAASMPFLAMTVAVLLAGALTGRLTGQHDVTAALGWPLAPAAGSLAAAVGTQVDASAPLMTAGVAGATGVAMGVTALLLTEQQREAAWTVLLGVVVTAVTLVVWGDLMAVGLPGDRAAAVVGLAVLAAMSFLPRLATQLTGLGRLADAAAEGDPVRRERVRHAARQSRAVLSGLLTGCGLSIVVMVAVLALGGAWQRGLGVLLAVALLLRARRYSRPAHVLPPAVSGLAALAALAGGALWATEGLTAAVTTSVALATGLILVAAALVELAPSARARVRIALDRAETVVLLVSGIAAFGVFNAFAWAYAVVR